MRAILMFYNCEGQSPDSVHKPQTLKIKESRAGIEPTSFFQRPVSGDTYLYQGEGERNELKDTTWYYSDDGNDDGSDDDDDGSGVDDDEHDVTTRVRW